MPLDLKMNLAHRSLHKRHRIFHPLPWFFASLENHGLRLKGSMPWAASGRVCPWKGVSTFKSKCLLPYTLKAIFMHADMDMHDATMCDRSTYLQGIILAPQTSLF